MVVLSQLKSPLINVKLQNGFDPTVWQDEPFTHWTPFTYILGDLREMSDCLFWTILRSIRGELR
jgi:hypothetical protein